MPLISVNEPIDKNLRMYQGDTSVFVFTTPSNTNVSGATITMSVKRQRGASVPAVWVGTSTDGQINVSGVLSNVVTATIPSSNASTVPSGSLVYDVQYVEGSIVATYHTGLINVERQVT